MPTDKELAARMFRALNHREAQLGHKLVLREISADVSRTMRRTDDYDPSVIARWLKTDQEPKTRAQWVALAKALGVDPGWLAFGDDSAAPMAPNGAVASGAPRLELREPQRPVLPRNAAGGERKGRRRGR